MHDTLNRKQGCTKCPSRLRLSRLHSSVALQRQDSQRWQDLARCFHVWRAFLLEGDMIVTVILGVLPLCRCQSVTWHVPIAGSALPWFACTSERL